MRKKICFVLTEMTVVMVLTCACSGGQKVEASRESAELTLAPDLNHNGIAEEVRLTDIDDGQGQRMEIWENNELIIWKRGRSAHTIMSCPVWHTIMRL